MIEINYEALESKSEADIEAMINHLSNKRSIQGAAMIMVLKKQLEKRINNLFII